VDETEARPQGLPAISKHSGVRLLTRNGRDWTGRFPLIAQAAGGLRARSFVIDGEAVACDGDGMPVFDRLRYRRQDGRVFLYAFDLLAVHESELRLVRPNGLCRSRSAAVWLKHVTRQCRYHAAQKARRQFAFHYE
jgi:hypothetical protein